MAVLVGGEPDYRAPMTVRWDSEAGGVVVFPSGRRVRGRALREPLPDGPVPDFGVYLSGGEPKSTPWPARWLRWPDFRVPDCRREAREALTELWERAEQERVEVACHGGHGRTGTALACVAVLDGVAADEAVSFVRRHYDHRAVETPWQRRYVTRFDSA